MADYADDFEAFWDVYPRKVSKRPASKAWDKLSPDEKAAAKSDVEKRNRAHWWSSDPKKIPHAATYLNAARWEDEWEGDLQARREAQATSGRDPLNYKTPVEEDASDNMRWYETVLGRAFFWYVVFNGEALPDGPVAVYGEPVNGDEMPAKAAEARNEAIRWAKALDEDIRAETDRENQRKLLVQSCEELVEFFLKSLDDKYGFNRAERTLTYAKRQSWEKRTT